MNDIMMVVIGLLAGIGIAALLVVLFAPSRMEVACDAMDGTIHGKQCVDENNKVLFERK